MCNTIGLLVIILVLYLLFKNKNILVIGIIVIILSYYFNYKEGMSASQKAKFDAYKPNLIKNTSIVKKVNNVVVPPKKIVPKVNNVVVPPKKIVPKVIKKK